MTTKFPRRDPIDWTVVLLSLAALIFGGQFAHLGAR